MFDRTEPAIGRTSRQTEAISFREIAAVCRLFLFAIWLSLPSPHGSDKCANTGKRTLPDTHLQILHVHTRQNLEDNPMRFDPIECGMRIKSLREEKGLTQVELSEQFRISLDHLKAIERGRRACSIDLFIEAAIAFNVSLDYLILGRTVTLDSIRASICEAIDVLERTKREL